ncbi:hypothetical protein PBCV1_a690cR [Paramecium bursaria Chlorella virus 1]|uniref:Uncharacterized protein n=1 Tax=Paramecium bursaria Chlorella virus 1 TaxID=10506 RepID=F8TU91_PBCV1|nr:hypothetical protein PBCV1_a690cR [Paramecium bursaria Chlorella virus 1]AEI70152.1 hypothetical protein [Paramecium bursaria Chlorella virus 1]
MIYKVCKRIILFKMLMMYKSCKRIICKTHVTYRFYTKVVYN